MCKEKKNCGICEIPKRNNYYIGKLMTVRDFNAEQDYFNEKRWLINRMVHGWGVVCGLDIEPIEGEADKVTVKPGLAIDCCGREILVCKPQEVSLKPEEKECHKENNAQQNDNNTYAICLKFKECRTEPVPFPSSACDQKERGEFNYIRDWFEIKVIPLPDQKDREHFCPKIKYCPKTNENEKKSLHEHVCDWLLNCPSECKDHTCVILATVILNEKSKIQGNIDKCSHRKVVYNNSLLYDLIRCYHGDLPQVCHISWEDKHYKEEISWEDFDELVDKGLKVTFNKLMNHDTINIHTFLVAVITVDEATGYRLLRYIPAEEIKREEVNGVTEATFVFEKGWKGDEVKKETKHSAIARGAEFEIILRGSSIFSRDEKAEKALDGSFMGKLPSGTGTQGSDFVSWFSVGPRS
ncbi:MAG TPA: hypothetical protein VER35_01430 [Candidatus Limnocylindrales bacterium]|nr:hypothetical protein [Candidatus Limnocylindrales bacterium]